MKIAIAGSGAMGSRFGFQLYEAGNDVILIDKWKEHVNKIRENGLKVERDFKEMSVNIPIYYPNEVTEKVDVIFIFTKSMGLEEMLQDIKPIIGTHTKVVSLLNGVGHESVLEKYVALKNIIQGVTILTSSLQAPGHVSYQGKGSTELQNFMPGEIEATKKIVNVIHEAGLNGVYSEKVKYSIWRKACVNGAMNAICALLEANLAEVGNTDQSQSIIEMIVEEFVMIANKKGVALKKNEMVNYILESVNNVGHHYPSMYQDLVSNRRYTEIDYLNGAVAKMAEDNGENAPYNQLITQLIHAKEQILDVK